MLIYNHKKEFIAIDEAALEVLSIPSIAELQKEVSDFADLFVSSPGLIHNFKHVHWIDYITCNEDATDSKAIIKIRGKNYSANIVVKVIYLLENPTEKAFKVELVNLKSLSPLQEEKITLSSLTEQEPQENNHKFKAPKKETTYENLNPNIIKDEYEEDSIQEEDYASLVNLQEEESRADKTPKTIPLVEKKEDILSAELKYDNSADESLNFSDYCYDPNVASDELGLPIDLVEEFIQDFIVQANSFKSDLYSSLAEGNMDNLKIQSHKLKGVAANLRIEDALDALSIVNSSHDEYDIQKNLDRFFYIINNLSKSDTKEPIFNNTQEDEFIISFKDETSPAENIEVLDSDVPEHIEIAILADDNFLKESSPFEKNNKPLINDVIDNEVEKVIFQYDKNQVAHDIGLDIDSFNELFSDYLTEAKNIFADINEALEENDLDSCKKSARKLKGMSENMRVYDFDASLEDVISATNINEIEQSVRNIAFTLTLISKNRG